MVGNIGLTSLLWNQNFCEQEFLMILCNTKADLGLLQNPRWSTLAVNYYRKALHLGCCSSSRFSSVIVLYKFIWMKSFTFDLANYIIFRLTRYCFGLNLCLILKPLQHPFWYPAIALRFLKASDHFYYYIISLHEFALKSISNSVVHWHYQERFKASVHLLIINTVLIKPISWGNQKFFRAGKVCWNNCKSINLSPTKHEKKTPKGNVLEFFSLTVF